ncbi:hypothetical protein OSB04_014171 [Centaurea solstitialis]|uniref:Nodulin-like domain-containing protein n=1 Tax=Centaurea solstitialis TaxID=347529 RepID=A0AA38TA14_9ASTR|nr:hypothetical protein OSB04_014171 [Centaurea solstitialis]
MDGVRHRRLGSGHLRQQYTFSNYSDALKSLMALTQLELNNLSVAKDWLVVSQKIQPLPYWQMCVFLCMGGNSTTWMNTAILVTCIRNFRKNRGPVAGILKGYVGLSTAIFTDVCTALFNNDPARFLLMLAVVPFVVCLFAVVFLREIPPSSTAAEEKSETRYFAIFNLIRSNPKTVDVESTATTEPLLIEQEDEPVLAEETKEESAQRCGGGGVEKVAPVIGEEHTVFEALKTVDFWILFISFLCGVGTGLAVQNNMGQMGLALGYADVSIFVSLTSIWGFFGRILSGSVSEYFIKKAGTPRPLWNAASQILMAVGYILMAIAMPGSLYIGAIVVGICYGVRLAITVPTASELFGLKYYGLIYNILILNLPLGSFLFSGLLAGFLYDHEATTTAAGGNTCIGAHCYRLVFIVMAFACVVGFGLDLWLAFRTKALYNKIYTSRKSKKSLAAANGSSR